MAKRKSTSKRPERIWCVTFMQRGKETHIADIPTTHITEGSLMSLMQMIYAKHSLTDEEIVCCNLRANMRKYRPLLKITAYRSQDPISFRIASGGTWVHAIVVRPGDTHPFSGEDKS